MKTRFFGAADDDAFSRSDDNHEDDADLGLSTFGEFAVLEFSALGYFRNRIVSI